MAHGSITIGNITILKIPRVKLSTRSRQWVLCEGSLKQFWEATPLPRVPSADLSIMLSQFLHHILVFPI